MTILEYSIMKFLLISCLIVYCVSEIKIAHSSKLLQDRKIISIVSDSDTWVSRSNNLYEKAVEIIKIIDSNEKIPDAKWI